MTGKTTSTTAPGLQCPECGFHIEVTISMLLNNAAVFCSSCGLKLTIDRDESREGLDQLKKLNDELDKARRAKKASLG